MKIKWETNSRVKELAADGLINHEDIIPRTNTNNFPSNTATVRLKDVRAKRPWVTVHIRGEGQSKTNNYNNYTWIHAVTMRVNFGHEYRDYSLSGELHGALDFTEVDEVVKKVKLTMGM